MALNKCIFSGYIYFPKDQSGNVPEHGVLQHGNNQNNSYLRFRVKNDKVGKKQDGSKSDPNWLNCVAWNKTAEHVQKYFKKGDPIIIEGKYDQRKAENNGTSTVYHDFIIHGVEFPPKEWSDNQNQSNNQQYQQPQQQQPYQQPYQQQPYQQPQQSYQQPTQAPPSTYQSTSLPPLGDDLPF